MQQATVWANSYNNQTSVCGPSTSALQWNSYPNEYYRQQISRGVSGCQNNGSQKGAQQIGFGSYTFEEGTPLHANYLGALTYGGAPIWWGAATVQIVG